MNRLLGGFGITFLGLSILLSGCSGGVSSHPGNGENSGTGQRFTLKNLNGENVSLDSLLAKNKAVLVNFWATWCPYCVEEIPDLVKLKAKYKDSPFEIVGINVGESAAAASAYAKKLRINYLVLLDMDNSVAENYRVVGIPTTYLIQSDGRVAGEYHAFTPELESDVEKILQ